MLEQAISNTDSELNVNIGGYFYLAGKPSLL